MVGFLRRGVVSWRLCSPAAGQRLRPPPAPLGDGRRPRMRRWRRGLGRSRAGPKSCRRRCRRAPGVGGHEVAGRAGQARAAEAGGRNMRRDCSPGGDGSQRGLSGAVVNCDAAGPAVAAVTEGTHCRRIDAEPAKNLSGERGLRYGVAQQRDDELHARYLATVARASQAASHGRRQAA